MTLPFSPAASLTVEYWLYIAAIVHDVRRQLKMCEMLNNQNLKTFK